MGLFLGHLHARHLIHLPLLRRRGRRRLLLLGGLCENLASFRCKIVGCKRVTKGSHSSFRC